MHPRCTDPEPWLDRTTAVGLSTLSHDGHSPPTYLHPFPQGWVTREGGKEPSAMIFRAAYLAWMLLWTVHGFT